MTTRPATNEESAVADKLANIERLATSGPQLSGSERAEYQISERLHRAEGNLRRAKKRGDAQKTTSAERSVANAQAALREFLSPKVDHLWAPARIVFKTEGHWHGKTGAGIHRWECEMVLDRKDLSGPHYRTVRVLKDEGAPPTNARSAPDSMGVAWFAIAEQIHRGQIVVLSEEASPEPEECKTCLGHGRIRDADDDRLRRCLDCGGSGTAS